LALTLIVGKVAFQARRHLDQAESALESNDDEEAVWHYQWAVRHYVPFLPANRSAVEALLTMAEAAGDDEQRRHVLRILRASLYAIRSIYQPFPDVLRRVEEELDLSSLDQPTRE